VGTFKRKGGNKKRIGRRVAENQVRRQQGTSNRQSSKPLGGTQGKRGAGRRGTNDHSIEPGKYRKHRTPRAGNRCGELSEIMQDGGEASGAEFIPTPAGGLSRGGVFPGLSQRKILNFGGKGRRGTRVQSGEGQRTESKLEVEGQTEGS